MASSWFQYDSQRGTVWVRWLPCSPAGRVSACDRCHRRVLPSEHRLQVDDDRGPERVRGKGKKHSYLCTDCGANVPQPTFPEDVDQRQLF